MPVSDPAGSTEAETTETDARRLALGERLLELRKSQGLSLRDAGERAGLSHSFIRMVELGKTEMAVSRLHRLAEAYGVLAADVLSDAKTRDAEYVPASRGIPVPDGGRGVQIEFVASPSWGVQPFVVRLDPGGDLRDLSHRGDEFLHCVKGSPVVIVDGIEYQLGVGDTVVVPERSEHSYHNRGRGPATLVGGVERVQHRADST